LSPAGTGDAEGRALDFDPGGAMYIGVGTLILIIILILPLT
jgi:hypothetical protein